MSEIIDRDYAGEGIYRENILDHYKNPRNFGNIENFDAEYHEFNSLCGDELTLQIKIENNLVKDIRFFGKGCAISIASSSMLSEEIKGKKVDFAKNITKENIFNLLNIQISPSRTKCALLCLEALRKLIKIYKGEK